jgi:hypothetical protein
LALVAVERIRYGDLLGTAVVSMPPGEMFVGWWEVSADVGAASRSRIDAFRGFPDVVPGLHRCTVSVMAGAWGSGERRDGPQCCSPPLAGERIGEQAGERTAKRTAVNCAELFRLRVTVSCHTVIVAAQSDSLEAYK